MFEGIKKLLLGKKKDPLDKKTRSHIALTALFAWVGLGADGLSSSCYGPQEAYLALGTNPHMALYLAIAMAITVFIISFAYNQVVELFPNGGGGYKVATQLIGPNAGVFAGCALLVDYTLTIVISIASGTDAFFSLLPVDYGIYKLKLETAFIILLMFINLRGMKESIKVLMPIFIGFVLTHLFMILYGIFRHGDMLPAIVSQAASETHDLAAFKGIFFTLALFLHAYSMGGGTYTGLEAVSNNVNMLAEPRIRTGKWTMFFMAVSLSFTAAGILLLYLLWNAAPEAGQTLNAVVFRSLLHDWQSAGTIITITLIFEFGLLFVGANTGFLGGPAVLANMALDQWVPNKFRNLSNRLVSQNGVILFGIAAIILLNATHGAVGYLIILYSINVFLAFSISIFGLCKHWWKTRKKQADWKSRLTLSIVGFIICSSILVVITSTQFSHGGWEAILITGSVVALCYFIRSRYRAVNKQLKKADEIFSSSLAASDKPPLELELDPQAPTAVFFIAKSKGTAMHTLLWVKRLFPDYFVNYIFISVGVVDIKSYGAEEALKRMQGKVEKDLSFFKRFVNKQGIPVKTFSAYGTDPVEECMGIVNKLSKKYKNCLFFSSQLVIEQETWLNRQLHNDTAFSLQHKLHLQGKQMMILPMKLSDL